MSVDERTLTIIKAMAKGPICDNDFCGESCLHCNSTEHDEFSSIRHKPECPVLLARTILKQQGTPINIYKVTYQCIDTEMGRRKYWTTINTHAIAFTLEEVVKEFTWERTRKVQAEFVREAPLQG